MSVIKLTDLVEMHNDGFYVVMLYCSQMAARSVYRTLQSAEDVCDTQRVLAVIVKIVDDPGNIWHFC